jgi:hypothetical protein
VHPFFTLGAASYLDARKGQFAALPVAGAGGESRARRDVRLVHEKLRQAVSDRGRVGGALRRSPRAAGFHVHLRDPEQVIPPASIHFDLQFELIDWSQLGVPDGREQLSLTLAIALPAEGGGLMVWNINRMEIEAMTDEARRAHMSANRHASRHPTRQATSRCTPATSSTRWRRPTTRSRPTSASRCRRMRCRSTAVGHLLVVRSPAGWPTSASAPRVH